MCSKKRIQASCRSPLAEDAERTFGPDCCKSGLQAIPEKWHSQIRVEKKDTRRLLGSVNIEDYVRSTEPFKGKESQNFWDYLIGYQPERNGLPHAYFVEIHPAGKEEHLKEVKRKRDWLEKYLKGSPFVDGQRWTSSYHWVASKKGPIFYTKEMVLQYLKGKVQFEGRKMKIPPLAMP